MAVVGRGLGRGEGCKGDTWYLFANALGTLQGATDTVDLIILHSLPLAMKTFFLHLWLLFTVLRTAVLGVSNTCNNAAAVVSPRCSTMDLSG